MASQLGATPRATFLHFRKHKHRFLLPPEQVAPAIGIGDARRRQLLGLSFRVGVSSNGGEEYSYLDMWKKAVDGERKAVEFQKIVENSDSDSTSVHPEELVEKSEEFKKILEVSSEERDHIQRMQVIDRAAAAIAAARSVLKESGMSAEPGSGAGDSSGRGGSGGGVKKSSKKGKRSWTKIVPQSEASKNGIPGPDFWSWNPSKGGDASMGVSGELQKATKPSENPNLGNPVMEKERSIDILSIPLESKLNKNIRQAPLPPLQSLMEVQKVQDSESILESPTQDDREIDFQSSVNAAEVADALNNVDEVSPYGVRTDGSRWWKETGLERRPDGVLCRWTMIRGISADQTVQWQEKFWEASDDFGYKELGSEKSGRDATGNVWREYWRESMGQENGLMNIEKTADKWGKNGQGDEWQENWWERYNASGEAEKWAHKWCSIDPNTPLEAGHAHIWHERWGEKYDGHGGSTKYTDKWAERSEGDGWTKWGDKWDEQFDPNGHGVKQGETWWAGKYGERWNRTWGEGHNGSGWIHKYGKSSCGEHWDTHIQQDTWYERFPHFGFYHCYDNSVQLREVPKPSDMV
ncbi:protein LIKE EARLY STARVATION, chloroplastic [Cannabis sativa]|uniref:protein LIKE EARLY STARVATION, chloroplastic n=1 Tax=Cannabis sativa TaxID=3483 RepID=UPI0029CA4C26|nr:protein LIKE EARLY STARVATION, chloroplastic [Cannabis sativa]